MPIWVFVPILLAAFLACPLSMWVMSKVMRRKVSCGMCSFGTEVKGNGALVDLEARKAAVEREIAQVKAEMEQRVTIQHATAKAKEG